MFLIIFIICLYLKINIELINLNVLIFDFIPCELVVKWDNASNYN